MRSSTPAFTISRLALEGGVSVETVRYYQRRGLLRVPDQPQGVRRYVQTDADRLRFIKRAQAMGFTLEEVRSLVQLREHPSCRTTRAIAMEKFSAIDEQIHQLQTLKAELASMIDECDRNLQDSKCPAIQRMEH